MTVYITPKSGGKTIVRSADRVKTFTSAFGAHYIKLIKDGKTLTLSVAEVDVEVE